MTETEISKKLCEALRKRARTVIFKVHGHAMQRQGWPDLYLSCPQWRGWIETKALKGKLDHYQKLCIAELLEAGDNVFILRFLTDNLFVIELFRNGETVPIHYFSFAKWPEAAEKLVIGLVEVQCSGTRTTT